MILDHTLGTENIFGASDFRIDLDESVAEILARVVAFILDCGDLLLGSHTLSRLSGLFGLLLRLDLAGSERRRSGEGTNRPTRKLVAAPRSAIFPTIASAARPSLLLAPPPRIKPAAPAIASAVSGSSSICSCIYAPISRSR